MHLLLIHQNFVDHSHPGGTRHLELGAHLVSMGHAVTIVASNLDYLTGERIAGEREVWMDGVRVIRAPALALLHHSFFGRAISYLSFMLSSCWVATFAGKPDIVLGTSPPLFQLPSAWIVARSRGCRFLLEIRDLWPKFAIDMGLLRNPFLIWAARGVERFFYRVADHVVVNSPAYREYLQEHGVDSDDITVVPNGVEASAFDPDARGASVRERFGLQGKFVVTYAGAMGPANDLWTVIAAAKRLESTHPGVHFVFAGGGIERDSLQAKVASDGLGNVTFAGHFSKKQVPELLAASDVCLACLKDLPAFRTVYPNKVFDYMAAGRPTVLAIDGVIREVIEESNGGFFVNPGCETSLAECICRLHSDPSLVAEMGRSAREFVVENFDRRKQAEQLSQLLFKLSETKSKISSKVIIDK